jgi:hypothetical protein
MRLSGEGEKKSDKLPLYSLGESIQSSSRGRGLAIALNEATLNQNGQKVDRPPIKP